ncbi:MAG: hypothetical protein HY650_00470 [Acidobacteria bacterium]|nr:hypothetical protein [Acidobacteriota bacterium]
MAQDIEWRVKAFMKIASRRLALAENPQAVENKKEAEAWGPLPQGSRAQMLDHLAKAVEESIINIEDAYLRDPVNPSLRKAITAFRESTDRLIPRLEALRSQVRGEPETQTLERALEAVRQANEDARESEPEPPTPKKERKPGR